MRVMCVCVCDCEGLRLMSVPFVNTLCLIFETEYLTDSETHRFGYAGWPASSKDPSSASLHCTGIIVTPPQMRLFFMWILMAQTQVLILKQQAIYWLSCLYLPKT